MSDKFSPISIQHLYHILTYGNSTGRLFGLPKELFYRPDQSSGFKSVRYGQALDTPLGVAAGPHTQMAQNIISAWLCGARYIELKTVQTLDELDISKPCIDMEDEGYNSEWSQELSLKESYDEYLNAWILIHVLNQKFNFPAPSGFIFNMSLGYDLEGIRQENVQWFLSKMKDCSIEKAAKLTDLKPYIQDIDKLIIPDTISDNVTLSTMHGCPPDEIEKIGMYLIREKKLHTTIKLNPTLLGPDHLREILNTNLEFSTVVPDLAFEHDLKYPDAVKIIQNLLDAASESDIEFGIKLTNTLETKNTRDKIGNPDEMVYMSGRALHPLAINLAKKLQNEFKGELDVSFSAGADCFNISEIIGAGFSPVTVCSDVLKPGGYGRLQQYLTNLSQSFSLLKANSIDEYILKKDGTSGLSVREAALLNLNKYAKEVVNDKAYRKEAFKKTGTKTNRDLSAFDCIAAPCVNTCPTNQDIPGYLYYTAKGDFENAQRLILRTNPFPSVLGMVCDHECQTKCVRSNYDDPLSIKAIKRFVMENTKSGSEQGLIEPNGLNAAIIGAGPSGLSCAHFLALSGFDVTVFESKKATGGMVTDAIPEFRLGREAIQKDIDRIKKLGVNIVTEKVVNKELFRQIQLDYKYVYIAVGAQKAKSMNIEGEDAAGVLNPLDFLSKIKQGKHIDVGNSIAVIGGGNTAMDAARTAARIVGDKGTVSVLYRRTKLEMPADHEEVVAALSEGINIIELIAPEKIIVADGKVKGISCYKMKLGKPDESGRARPEKIEGSESELEFDTIIPAIGQDRVLDFVDEEQLGVISADQRTKLANVYIGGDAYRGASTVIHAVADGKNAALQIINSATRNQEIKPEYESRNITHTDHQLARVKRVFNESGSISHAEFKKDFSVTDKVMSVDQAVKEASRCLQCDEYCSICETVCPNRANYTYLIEPVAYYLQKASKREGAVVIEDDEYISINQKYQVLNINDFCNECGNCTTFCPTKGEPYKDKPGLFLTFKSFNSSDKGYFINSFGGNTTLMYKDGKSIKTLTKAGNLFLFDTDNLVARLSCDDFKIIDMNFKKADIETATFRDAVEMSVILDACRGICFSDSFF